MKILGNRILVSKIEEEKSDGFQIVNVQDSFVYKGKIEQLGVELDPDCNRIGKVGDVLIFAKYSPDTQEIEYEGKKMKVVKIEDVIAVL